MTSDPTTERQARLDEVREGLAAQFSQAASRKSPSQRRWPAAGLLARTRGWMGGLLIAVVCGVPAGLAIGQVSGDDGVEEGTSQIPEIDVSAEEAERRNALGAAEPQEAEGNYIAVSPVDPAMAEDCRKSLETDPDDLLCQVIIATDEGNLPPGEYSDSELSAALEEAGVR